MDFVVPKSMGSDDIQEVSQIDDCAVPHGMDFEDIQVMSPIFAQLGIKNPVAAAAYYVLLLKKFPTTFKEIDDDARILLGGEHSTKGVKDARLRLLREGFIAQVLPLHDQDVAFNRELFLPISPKLIWEDNIEVQKRLVSLEELESKQRKIETMQKVFASNFKKNGIRIGKGSISLFHNSQWLLYNIVYNKESNENLSMFLGSLGSFVKPLIRHYENVVKSGKHTRIIFDKNDINALQRLPGILELRNKYPENIEIRANPTINATSRKFIYDTMAIDSVKLLIDKNSPLFKKLFKPKKNELYYISTIYLEQESIDYLTEAYNHIWKLLGPESAPYKIDR